MAFQKNQTAGHATMLGKSTLAEMDALLTAMTTLERAQVVGSHFEVTGDSTATNNGVWVITATTRVKVSNDAETGTMDKWTVKVGSSTEDIVNNEIVEYAGAGLISVELSAGGNGEAVVTTKIASTVADAGKVVKVNSSGDAVLAAENFIDIEDGLTVNLGLDAGTLTAEVIANTNQGITNTAAGVAAKLSADSRQAVSFGSDGGIYAKALAIAADSQTRLSYDANTNTIGLTALGMTRVLVDSTSSDATEAFTDNAADMQEGDVIIITGAGQAYIHNGGDTGTISDWTLIETPEITDAAIKALFGGELGVKFNATSGKFSADLRTVDVTHANDIQLDGDHLFVDILAKQSDIGLAGGEQTLQKNLTDLVTYAAIAVDRSYTNALSTTTDVNGKVTGVKHGGSLTEATTVQVGNYDYTLASNGTGWVQVTTDNFRIKNRLVVTNDAGDEVAMKLSSFNTWYRDTTYSPN